MVPLCICYVYCRPPSTPDMRCLWCRCPSVVHPVVCPVDGTGSWHRWFCCRIQLFPMQTIPLSNTVSPYIYINRRQSRQSTLSPICRPFVAVLSKIDCRRLGGIVIVTKVEHVQLGMLKLNSDDFCRLNVARMSNVLSTLSPVCLPALTGDRPASYGSGDILLFVCVHKKARITEWLIYTKFWNIGNSMPGITLCFA